MAAGGISLTERRENGNTVKKVRPIVKIALSLLGVLVLSGGVCAWYINDYYHVLPETAAVSASVLNETSDPAPQIRRTASKHWLTYGDTGWGRGLIFYPGAKVEEEAYGPLMEAFAAKQIFCIIVRMPGRLAVLDGNAADDVMKAYPQIDTWYLGGHSLGGAMAAAYAHDKSSRLSGLVLLAAYSTNPLPDDLPVLSLYGSLDGVLDMDKYREYRGNLPLDTVEYVIEGGNHAGFGWYGEQKGDGEALIDPEVQWQITADTIAEWM